MQGAAGDVRSGVARRTGRRAEGRAGRRRPARARRRPARPTGWCWSPRRRSSARACTAGASARARPTRRARSSRTCAAWPRATTSSTSSTASGATRGSSTRTSPASPSTSSRSSTRGGDKLYLPVWRLNQLEKYAGGESGAPKLDRLGGSTFARTKARVAREVRKMADELLRLYAERQALPRRGPPAGRRRLPRLRGHVPLRRDGRPGARHRRGEPRPRAPTAADGPARLRRRRLRQDRGRAARRVPRGDGGQAGGAPLPDDRARPAALPHLRGAHGRLPGDHPLRCRASRRKKEQDETLARPQGRARSTSSSGTHRLLSKDVHFKDLGPPGRRRGAALRRRPQGAHQAAARAGRRADADGDAHPAHAADGRRPGCATSRSSRRRPSTGAPCAPSSRAGTTRSSARRSQRELARGGQVFYVYNRIDKLYEKAQRLQELVPRRASPSRTGR